VSRNGGSESEGGGDVLHRGNVRFDRVEERSERFVENTILRNECGIS
jgi:hypothetical protein